MLTLYHNPISGNSRRVWISLLEKSLEFNLVEVALDGDQLQPDFLALNPFHHIPVLTDNGFRVIESLAILDYLEAKYPSPTLLPTQAQDVAIVRMVSLVTVNEISPHLMPLTQAAMGFAGANPQKVEQAKQQAAIGLRFLESQLGDRPYFGGEMLSLADIVAGTIVPWFPTLGVELTVYPQLQTWVQRLQARPSWQATQPTPAMLAEFRSRMEQLMAQYSQR